MGLNRYLFYNQMVDGLANQIYWFKNHMAGGLTISKGLVDH